MTILSLTLSNARPWDLAGIGASTLCILHCAATPLLVVVLPALEIFERQTHAGFALSILCIGLLAFVPGYRRHHRWQIVLNREKFSDGDADRVSGELNLREMTKRAAMDTEKELIRAALERLSGNVSAVARHIGISPRAVHQKLRKHAIDPYEFRRK